MRPPLFQTCAASGAVTDLLGVSPVRIYPFGEAPQGTATPYATWRRVAGVPGNYLGQVPDIDSITTQVDVYAETATEATAAAMAMRDAIEPVAYVVGWGPEGRDAETRLHRITFDVDWFVHRAP